MADWIDQLGYDSTLGLSSKSFKPLAETAAFVKAMMDLKASPLFRSSVNQSCSSIDSAMFTHECCNNLWGRAANPHKKEFSTGGACGGEAALVSTFCVGMGIAVDRAGDARYPAACCGVVAFKPTSSRVSEHGISADEIVNDLVKPVITPIARSVKDIIHLFRCLWDSRAQSQYDFTVSPLKFRAPYFESSTMNKDVNYYACSRKDENF